MVKRNNAENAISQVRNSVEWRIRAGQGAHWWAGCRIAWCWSQALHLGKMAM